MDDSTLVRCIERIRYLTSDDQRFTDWQTTTSG